MKRAACRTRSLLSWTASVLLVFCAVTSAKGQAVDPSALLVHAVKPISSQRILPDTLPSPAKASPVLQAEACRGEFEPASFILRALKNDMEGVTLEATELKSETAVIPRDRVDLKVVKVWYQAGTAWFGIRSDQGRVLVPELLLNDDTLIRVDTQRQANIIKLPFPDGEQYRDISREMPVPPRDVLHSIEDFPVRDAARLQPVHLRAGQTQQFWVTFHIPQDASSGSYEGFIALKAQGRPIGAIPVQVKVLPFVLEKPKIEYSLYYVGKLKAKGVISSAVKNQQQLRAELQNMWNHGVTNPTVYQDFDNKALLKKVLQIRKEVGMTGRPLYYLGIRTEQPANPSAVARYISQTDTMRALMKPYGVPELYVYGIDEASPELLQKQKDVWRTLRTRGVKIFVAGWTPGHFEQIGEDIDLFVDGQPPKRKEADKFHKVGRRIFSYNQPQVGVENPLIYRKNYGLRLWQEGYDGAMTYAYQDGFGSIWNDFDHTKFRDHCFTYPTVNGVIDTIAWEGFREGVDDVRYITTLEKRVRLAASRQGRQGTGALSKARSFLEGLKSYGGDDLDSIRQQTIGHILNLIQSDKAN